jgi:uncharacterized protein DUF6010
MISLIIGISSALLTILFIAILKQLDKTIVYGLILSGIGFLYVGFVWTDLQAFIVNAIQAIVFVFLAYYGIKKGANVLAAGYFLHGCWDLAYGYIQEPALIPPHYDLFCSSLDFVIGAYILLFSKQFSAKSGLTYQPELL